LQNEDTQELAPKFFGDESGVKTPAFSRAVSPMMSVTLRPRQLADPVVIVIGHIEAGNAEHGGFGHGSDKEFFPRGNLGGRSRAET
jgi:hypothetical protein